MNIFIEMVILVAVDCKKDTGQEIKFLQISERQKSETGMVHKNKT